MNRQEFAALVQTYLLACMFNGYYRGSANTAMRILAEDVQAADMEKINQAYDSQPIGSKWTVIVAWCDWKLGRQPKPEWA